MSEAACKILQDVLALPEDERLELASEIIASIDGPKDADWEATWLAELDRRTQKPQRPAAKVAATGPKRALES